MNIEKKLKVLLEGVEILSGPEIPDLNIESVSSNSSEIKKGSLFVAISGFHSDGHNYLGEALKKGAVALLGDQETEMPPWVPYFKVAESRKALSRISANFFQAPSHAMKVLGVTGTNGKTTITYLTEAMLKKAGVSTAVLGTINYRWADKVIESSHTTPESSRVQEIFAQMREDHVEVALLEVSSHALDLCRVDDVAFDMVVFNNLSSEHLDYHKSMELYFEAKKKLFKDLLERSSKKEKRALVNVDDFYGKKLLEQSDRHLFYRYSLSEKNHPHYHVIESSFSLEGISAKISTPEGVIQFKSPLIGNFNLSNILASIAMAHFCGVKNPEIQEALEGFSGVPGRLERVPNDKGIYIFVDYAHTPDALKNVLKTIHDIEHSRMITVFGCGGDRDASKRPLMGEEVARFSDLAIVTSDNPRTEDPQSIIEDILPGINQGGLEENESYFIELDRKKAIFKALDFAKEGDVVLIAGKGHEDYQILGNKTISFDDRKVAREYFLQ